MHFGKVGWGREGALTSHDRHTDHLPVSHAPKFTALVETYTLDEYEKDIQGYTVTQTVHVEALWPGDPVGETRWVCP